MLGVVVSVLIIYILFLDICDVTVMFLTGVFMSKLQFIRIYVIYKI